MNKAHLAQILSERLPFISKPQAERLLDELVSIITTTIKSGEEVALAGFGAFSARKRKGRIGINPRNISEKINIPSVLVVKFKAGKNLKDTLKKFGAPSRENTPPASTEPRP
jgi:DNA-binding protein HU-beta